MYENLDKHKDRQRKKEEDKQKHRERERGSIRKLCISMLSDLETMHLGYGTMILVIIYLNYEYGTIMFIANG